MLYGYTCLNMKSFYSILASFIFWPEDTSPNFTKEGGLISADNFVNFHLMHPVGTQYFIYNSVKENGYTWAALSFKTPKAVTMRGEWSPDSVPQSGVVQI